MNDNTTTPTSAIKIKITNRLLRWLVCWGGLFDGLIGVATLGYCDTSLRLDTIMILAQWRYKNKVWMRDGKLVTSKTPEEGASNE